MREFPSVLFALYAVFMVGGMGYIVGSLLFDSIPNLSAERFSSTSVGSAAEKRVIGIKFTAVEGTQSIHGGQRYIAKVVYEDEI